MNRTMDDSMDFATSETTHRVLYAIAQAQQAMAPVPKNGWNGAFKSKYANFDDCMSVIRPAFADRGLHIAVPCRTTPDGKMMQACVFITWSDGKESEWIRYPWESVNFTAKNAHEDGKAKTYVRRHAVTGALALRTGEDDDGNTAAGRQDGDSRGDQRPAPDTTPAREAVAAKDFYAALTTLGTHFRDKDDARLWAFFAHEADKYGGQAGVAKAAGWPVAKWKGNNDGLGFVARELATRRRDQGRAK